MDLQDTFYLVGIIYMIFMTLVTIGVIVAVIVLNAKLKRAKRMVNKKVDALRDMADGVAGFLHAVRHIVRS